MANEDFTDHLEALVLEWAFNVGTPTRPPAAFLGLFETTPTADAGTGGVEQDGGGYARQAIAFTLTDQTLNPTAIETFGPATGADWDTCNGFGIWDAITGGNLLAFKDLTTPRTVLLGDSASFATADLTITVD